MPAPQRSFGMITASKFAQLLGAVKPGFITHAPKGQEVGVWVRNTDFLECAAISAVSIEGGKAAWTGRVVLFQKFFVILNVMGPKVNHKGDAFSSKPQEIPGRLICGFYVVKMYVDQAVGKISGTCNDHWNIGQFWDRKAGVGVCDRSQDNSSCIRIASFLKAKALFFWVRVREHDLDPVSKRLYDVEYTCQGF